jgi:hypothetical protein
MERTVGNFRLRYSDLSAYLCAGPNQTVRIKKPPEEILVPLELFKLFPASKCEVMMRFIADVEKTTDVHVADFDVAALWNAQAPPNCTRPVTEYLSKVRMSCMSL